MIAHRLFASLRSYNIYSDLWLGYLLLAMFLSIGLILDCAFDSRQFVFDPNFTHWAVKTGNDKAY